MKIQVHLFAGLRELVGEATLAVELPEGATVGEALACLRQQHQALAGRPFLSAVNERYAAPEQKLAERDELALIPPVSGG